MCGIHNIIVGDETKVQKASSSNSEDGELVQKNVVTKNCFDLFSPLRDRGKVMYLNSYRNPLPNFR